MSKKEAIVDTCFFNKLSNGGKDIDCFRKVLIDLDFTPLVHPYIVENELDVFPQFDKLVEEGFVRKVEYNEFIEDDDDAELYKHYFVEIHEEMRTYYELKNSRKQIDVLAIPDNLTIFTYRRAGMSLGDVHIILMAFFMKVPVILSEDGDIEFLRSVAKRKISTDNYTLDIYSVLDLLNMVAKKEDTSFMKKELERIVMMVNERSQLSSIKQAWNATHRSL